MVLIFFQSRCGIWLHAFSNAWKLSLYGCIGSTKYSATGSLDILSAHFSSSGSLSMGIIGAMLTCTLIPASSSFWTICHLLSAGAVFGSIMRVISSGNGVTVKCMRGLGRFLIRSMSWSISGLRVNIPTFLNCGFCLLVSICRAVLVILYLASTGWYGSVMVPSTSLRSFMLRVWCLGLVVGRPFSSSFGVPSGLWAGWRPSLVLIVPFCSSLGRFSARWWRMRTKSPHSLFWSLMKNLT